MKLGVRGLTPPWDLSTALQLSLIPLRAVREYADMIEGALDRLNG
jgi:hypothetical protein